MNERLLKLNELVESYYKEQVEIDSDEETYEMHRPALEEQDAKTAAAKDAEYKPLVEAVCGKPYHAGDITPDTLRTWATSAQNERYYGWACYFRGLGEALAQLEAGKGAK